MSIMPHCCSPICKSFSLTTDVQSASWNSRKVVLVENCCCSPSHWLGSLCRAGSVKFDKRMYFLENDRRYCRTYNNLEASLQKELSFYQQKAKEWAEVHTRFFLLFFCENYSWRHSWCFPVTQYYNSFFILLYVYSGKFCFKVTEQCV